MFERQRQAIEEAELRRLYRVKQQPAASAGTLGQDMLSFFKHSVQKRQTKLSTIAECWMRLVPEPLLEHCALESFHAGTLKVMVDSSAHLYELKQLLLAGLQQQLLLACKSAGLRRISLKPGRWYEGEGNDRRIRF
ncbi:DciA family protein [Fontivita pretiosa]|uniref:DciA family protein n=1 Tax=Fontivita pretiosa TaxID=2989684 RepID=UPI003D16F840